MKSPRLLVLFSLAATGCLPTHGDYQEVRDRLQDIDGDGQRSVQYGGTDCDDRDAGVFLGAPEVCDLVDNDCDGAVDGAGAKDATTWYGDGDGDGFGTDLITVRDCESPTGFVEEGGDCDDTDPAIHPETIWYVDGDGDGFGSSDHVTTECDPGGGWVLQAGDCDDGDMGASPGVDEACGGGDEDCDGAVDEAGSVDSVEFFQDKDEDGFGADDASIVACNSPDGYSGIGGDCDDFNAAVHPDAVEICGDNRDNDCDGGPGECLLSGVLDLAGHAQVVVGEAPSDRLGTALSFVPDVNGGGTDGAVAGAVAASEGGLAYHLLKDDFLNPGDTADDAFNVFRASGAMGIGVSSAGVVDFDGDGLAEVALGADTFTEDLDQPGAVMFVSCAGSGDRLLPDAAVALFVGDGEAARFGDALSSGLDATGDGVDDLLVGSPGWGGTSPEGAVFLFSGEHGSSVTAADAVAIIVGEGDGSDAGDEVVLVDMNGDGIAELVVGSPMREDHGRRGEVSIFSGPVDGSFSLADADHRLLPVALDRAGAALAAGGDITGDGYEDLLVGAPNQGSVSPYTGAVYVIQGPVPASEQLSDAAIRLEGESSGDYAGSSVAGNGDFDRDGVPDVVVGAPGSSRSAERAGAVYMVLGPLAGVMPLADSRFVLTGGSADDQVGHRVALDGDLNGDAFSDLLIGAPGVDTLGEGEGAVYLVYGSGM